MAAIPIVTRMHFGGGEVQMKSICYLLAGLLCGGLSYAHASPPIVTKMAEDAQQAAGNQESDPAHIEQNGRADKVRGDGHSYQMVLPQHQRTEAQVDRSNLTRDASAPVGEELHRASTEIENKPLSSMAYSAMGPHNPLAADHRNSARDSFPAVHAVPLPLLSESQAWALLMLVALAACYRPRRKQCTFPRQLSSFDTRERVAL